MAEGAVFQQALVDSISMIATSRAMLHPMTSFGLTNLKEAVQHRVTPAYMGKNVIMAPSKDEAVETVADRSQVALDPKATYLIVGGVGGVGAAIADWMISRGARRLLLISRRAEEHAEASALRERGRQQGCVVEVRNCDVTDSNALAQLLEQSVADGGSPVRGVIQGAMVLASSLLQGMSFEQWVRATRPKVQATLNLHQHCRNVDFFIMLSSITGVVGSASQANYTAGNTFQDMFARWRHAQGLPAITIDLGLITDIRWGAAEESLRGRLEPALKATAMSCDDTLSLIHEAVAHATPSTAETSQIVCYGSQHQTFAGDEGVRTDLRFAPLRAAIATAALQSQGGDSGEAQAMLGGRQRLADLQARLMSSEQEASEFVEPATAVLVDKFAADFNLDSSEVDPSIPLGHYGVDSLVATQLRSWFTTAFRAKISIFDILQSQSMVDLANKAVQRSEFRAATSGGVGQEKP